MPIDAQGATASMEETHQITIFAQTIAEAATNATNNIRLAASYHELLGDGTAIEGADSISIIIVAAGKNYRATVDGHNVAAQAEAIKSVLGVSFPTTAQTARIEGEVLVFEPSAAEVQASAAIPGGTLGGLKFAQPRVAPRTHTHRQA